MSHEKLMMEIKSKGRNSLAVQGLGLCTFTAEGLCSVPGQGTKISQSTCWHGQKEEEENPKELNCEPMWKCNLWLQMGREDQCIFQ